MRILQRMGVCIAPLVLAFGFSACTDNLKYQSEIYAMDTIMTLTAYGENGETAVKLAEDEINRLDSLFSVGKSQSEIYRLNIDKEIVPSKDTEHLINRALELSVITDGDFDITVAPLMTAWGFYSGADNRVPDKDEIDLILNEIGYENIQVDEDKIIIDENTTLDFGGIAKGYASSRVAQIMEENGVTSGLVSLGGNVRVVGHKPDGSNWTVAIADPDNTALQIGQLSVADTSVVTSGGYQRFFEDNGQIYHHIIDPENGYPSDSGLKSVTIVADDDTLADALSTALFVKGLDESIEFHKNSGEDFEAVFVTDDDEIYITANLENIFHSDRAYEVINA